MTRFGMDCARATYIACTILLLLSAIVSPAQEARFRTETRLVEMYATVKDHDGRYVDGLSANRFQLKDNGELQQILGFASNTNELSCAILIDTTGSMTAALPSVKNSVIRMIDELRPEDSVAVYSFSSGVNHLEDFTTDRAAVKQAVLRTRAGGDTALFDAISETARDIASRTGKKALIVFTDGADNASLLNARSAIQRAKKTGVPVYTIAEGDARKSRALLNQLKDIAEATGAESFEATKSSEIASVFHKIAEDLQHTYMLTYRPPQTEDPKWRTIELIVSGIKEPKIRGKEGYFP